MEISRGHRPRCNAAKVARPEGTLEMLENKGDPASFQDAKYNPAPTRHGVPG